MSKTFACEFTGAGGKRCAETAYHRHCVRCGELVNRRKGILCSSDCRGLDTTWQTAANRVLCDVRPLGQKAPTRQWLPAHLVNGRGKGPK